jgi:hypothetical protein
MAPKHSIDSVPLAATVRWLSTEYWRSLASVHWMATVRSLAPKHSIG